MKGLIFLYYMVDVSAYTLGGNNVASDYFIKKCQEQYPQAEIKNYLVFTEAKRTSFWCLVLSALVSVYERTFVLYRTVDGTFVIAKIGVTGSFTAFEYLDAIAFKAEKKKNQVSFVNAGQYDQRYQLVRAYNTTPSDIGELVRMLTRGDYDY